MKLEDFIGTHAIHTVTERTICPVTQRTVRRKDGADPGELAITATSVTCPAGAFKIAGCREWKKNFHLAIEIADHPEPIQCGIFRCGPYLPRTHFGLMIRPDNGQTDYVFEVKPA